jgi:hypothetical protein
MPKFSGRPKVYDRDQLHRYLFEHTNSRGVVRVHQGLLADELGCDRATVRILIGELKLLGRIERVVGPGRTAHFRVNEPEGQPVKSKATRVPVWG